MLFGTILSKFFRSKTRVDTNHFNCFEQKDEAWIDRAEIAANLIAEITQSTERKPFRLADIGCGDQKLRGMLMARIEGVEYLGFDLIPQSESVIAFDLENQTLPVVMDAAVLLGVLEYSEDILAALVRLRPMTRFLVVSHAVKDLREKDQRSKRRLNWKSHLTEADFAETLTMSGFAITDRRLTSNNRSVVWVCK
jgi:hypothetical protein